MIESGPAVEIERRRDVVGRLNHELAHARAHGAHRKHERTAGVRKLRGALGSRERPGNLAFAGRKSSADRGKSEYRNDDETENAVADGPVGQPSVKDRSKHLRFRFSVARPGAGQARGDWPVCPSTVSD